MNWLCILIGHKWRNHSYTDAASLWPDNTISVRICQRCGKATL